MQTVGCCIRRLALCILQGSVYRRRTAMPFTSPSSAYPKTPDFATSSRCFHTKTSESRVRIPKLAFSSVPGASESPRPRGCMLLTSTSSGRRAAKQTLACSKDVLQNSSQVDESAASSPHEGVQDSPLQQAPIAVVNTTGAGQSSECSSEEAQPLDQDQQQDEQQGQEQPSPKQKKAIVPPTPIPPPTLPSSPEPWQNGVLLIDKPKTWTSFDVCAKLRGGLKLLQIKKVGHAGTLDPMATGLLIVCCGRGTKAIDSYMGMPKEYTGTLRLGEGTPSYDADTEVNEKLPWEHITDAQVLAARQGFVGAIQQVPPMFSALRVGGKRLYEVARKGGEVEREPRSVTVELFDLERDASDHKCFHFRVVCSKGTYIRSLAHDLGRALGSVAHLTALRREAIGEYRVGDAWQIQDLAQKLHALKKSRRDAEAQAEQEGEASLAEEGALAAGSSNAAN